MRGINLNVIIDLLGVLIVSVMLHRRTLCTELTERDRMLRALMINITLVFLFDIPAWLLDGVQFAGSRELLYVLNTIFWVLQIVYCWLWLLFSVNWCMGALKRPRAVALSLGIPAALETAAIAANLWTGWIFRINDAGSYIRGEYYTLNILPYAFYILAAAVPAIIGLMRHGSGEKKRQCMSFLTFMILPALGTAIETVSYGISWIWPLAALSLMMAYLSIRQQELADFRLREAKIEAELADSRIAIMLSQIQPHFLFNALNTIKYLCDIGSPEAGTAVEEFAGYLRGNMDSLTAREPVIFERELEHLKHFLAIEELRFPNAKIAYNIGVRDFLIPALTIQPLVENAIRYGINQREEGGTVTISTLEDAKSYIVRIEDDGVGFDINAEKDDGRSHIGIKNVRSRLEALCEGELRVESTINVGTVVTLTIPKERTA